MLMVYRKPRPLESYLDDVEGSGEEGLVSTRPNLADGRASYFLHILTSPAYLTMTPSVDYNSSVIEPLRC